LTPAFVADASVCAAWFLPDEATPYTEAALQATAETTVWVPALWPIEIANLLLSAQRRRRVRDSLKKVHAD
jgi:predicted nucleic acid-binding protein